MKMLRSKEAVALVITLIMMSVITVVVVAFLVLAMHDRRAAGTADKMTRAQLMADAARNRAIAEIQAQILEGHRNGAISLMAFDVLVSHPETNIVDPYRLFAPVINIRAGTVEADTNLTFLDLNRNGFYDPPGTNGPGDPEWIADTEKPGPPAEKNHIVGRYAYVVQPAGKSLDLNFIGNQAKQALIPPFNPASEGHLRGSGLGSWELNLASFLVDLNRNAWQLPGAYEDAFDFLRYRYDTNLTFLADAPPPLFELEGYTNNWAGSDNPRHYYDPAELFNANRTYTNFTAALNWLQSPVAPGIGTNDYNNQTFYRLLSQMGMDSVPVPPKFNLNYINLRPDREPVSGVTNWIATNLVETGFYASWTNNPSLFFNQVAALLLKDLKDQTRFDGVTNLAPLLVASNEFRIPLWPSTNNNFYTPAVHRILQLTANLYDATQEGLPTGQMGTNPAYARYFPTVFRPVFRKERGVLYLVRYEAVSDHVQLTKNILSTRWHDLQDPAFQLEQITAAGDVYDFIYGVPLIVGAKKGFPNFNELTMDTEMVVSRKLELVKESPELRPNRTNQLYFLAVTNRLGFEAWNSYETPYPNDLSVFAAYVLTSGLVANSNSVMAITNLAFGNTNLGVPANGWRAKAFRTTVFTNITVLPPLPYRFQPAPHFAQTGQPEPDVSRSPEWDLSITNKTIFYIFDRRFNRLVDFVSLSGLTHRTNIMSALMEADDANLRRLWDTNRDPTVTYATRGVKEQVDIATGDRTVSLGWWRSHSTTQDKENAIATLKKFIEGDPDISIPTLLTQRVMSVGFNPVTRLYLTGTWQANDPLVHLMEWDLIDLTNHVKATIRGVNTPLLFPSDAAAYNLGRLNTQYRPWYKSVDEIGSDTNAFNLAVQDPMVRSSEDWDFPEGKFPNVGWLGRVHRATPWQTVYLKAEAANAGEWYNRSSGSYLLGARLGFTAGATNVDDALKFGWWPTHPTNDWRLVDLFSTAPNANATRGTLSINQANQAAWSAVLGGVQVVMNNRGVTPIEPSPAEPVRILKTLPNFLGSTNIAPASPELTAIVDGIHRYRAVVRTNIYDGVFNRLSEVLAVPELSVNRKVVYSDGTPARSPFLYMRSPGPGQDNEQRVRLTDAAYEWLPMQILSLLRVGEPRVVIYAYGQSLEPYGPDYMGADGPSNYRVTAEYATRTVVRYDLEPMNPPTNSVLSLRPVIESFNILTPDG